jgi:hypothetical protein
VGEAKAAAIVAGQQRQLDAARTALGPGRTVVFNGNPLLRFDGYYITMDTLEIPNLRQKSSEILKRWFQKNCLGLELQDNPFLPQRNQFLFGIYTIASFIYRWVVAFGIIMFLNQILKPYGLQSLGRAFAIAGFAGMVVPAVMAVVKFFKTPGKAAKMKQANMLTSLGIALAVLSFICFFPLPFHVYCPTEVRPDNAIEVRTLVAGKLDQWKNKPGLQIYSGDEICSLQNPELLIQRETALSDVRSAETMLTQMRYLSGSDPKWSSSVETQESELRQKRETLATLDDKLKNLTVRSPLGGHVFQPPEKEDSKAAKSMMMNSISNSRGALATKGTGLLNTIQPSQKEKSVTKSKHQTELADILNATNFGGAQQEFLYEVAPPPTASGLQKSLGGGAASFRAFIKKGKTTNAFDVSVLVIMENKTQVLGYRVYERR